MKCGDADGLKSTDTLSSRTLEIVYPRRVQYRCQIGYSRIGVFGWDRDSSVRCQSVGKFTPTVPCLPNTVGQPPFVNTSQYGDKVYFYPETLEDTCRQGYVHAGNSTLRADPDGVWVFARPFH